MSERFPMPGSLVLYKSGPALVTGVSDKIDITLPDGGLKRVRPKDIALLHPGPLKTLAGLGAILADLDEAWELIVGESVELEELAALIHGEFTPASAWATWLMVAEGRYFEGTPEKITARSREQIEADLSASAAKAAAEREWKAFLARLAARTVDEGDWERLREVEQLAFGRSERSRILAALGRKEDPVTAHRMLIDLGVWDKLHNPYPGRLALAVEDPEIELPPLPEEERMDLTGLATFAIDDEGSQDPDDAVSLEGDRIWVHVADVAALVRPDSPLDIEARTRAANLYLPEKTVHMLPPRLTHMLGLGLQESTPALSFGFRLSQQAEIEDLIICPSWIKVSRKSYTEVEKLLRQEPFNTLLQLARRYGRRRAAAGAASLDLPEVSVKVSDAGEIRIRPVERLASREMVTELMLMAGEAIAAYTLAKGIPIPFATQPAPEETRVPKDLAGRYAFRRTLMPSRANTLEAPHAGLGLKVYTRTTSPLRRYLDLVTHQQLRAHLGGESVLTATAISERISTSETVTAGVRRAERLSNLHWKLLWLQRNPGWRGRGVVVARQQQRLSLLIPELAMETRVRSSREAGLNSELDLVLREVDVPDQMAWFRLGQ